MVDQIEAKVIVTSNRETQISDQPTQMSQQSSGSIGGSSTLDETVFLCRNFYDILSKRLRRASFSQLSRRYSRKLLAPVTHATTSVAVASSPESSHRQRKRTYGTSNASDGSTTTTTTSGSVVDKRVRHEQTAHDMFMLAYNELQLSAVPHSLPCREKERSQLYRILRNAICNGGQQPTVYVSGMPGTGKTATVLEVVRKLRSEVAEQELPFFNFVQLNAMHLTHPHHAYRDILFRVTGEICARAHAAENLKRVFNLDDPNRAITLLLVDEIDFLATKKQVCLV